MRVEVAYAAPGTEERVALELSPGARVADALRACGLMERLALDPARVAFAIHGQRTGLDTPLADGDRVEILRELCADPKAARRRRAALNPLPPTRRPPKPRSR